MRLDRIQNYLSVKPFRQQENLPQNCELKRFAVSEQTNRETDRHAIALEEGFKCFKKYIIYLNALHMTVKQTIKRCFEYKY